MLIRLKYFLVRYVIGYKNKIKKKIINQQRYILITITDKKNDDMINVLEKKNYEII